MKYLLISVCIALNVMYFLAERLFKIMCLVIMVLWDLKMPSDDDYKALFRFHFLGSSITFDSYRDYFKKMAEEVKKELK